MDLFITCVPEQFIMQHDVLPSDRLIKFKFYLVDLMLRLHVNEKVGVIENCIYEQIRRVLCVVNFSCGWFDKFVLENSSFAFFQQNPAMDSFTKEKIRC